MTEVIHSLEKIRRKTCVALGFFDGIHMGHRCIIENMLRVAKAKDAIPVVFTFSKNPQEILTDRVIPKIISDDAKASILSSLGVEKMYAVDFREIMKLSADEFINDIIIGTLNAVDVFCGFNYHFGAYKLGDSEYLKQRLSNLGVNVYIEKEVNYKGQTVSSTRIRKLILDGNVEEANLMLTRNFGFKSRVLNGKKLGRLLGYPTINQEIPSEIIIPKCGVYKSKVKIGEKHFDALTNIGISPTVFNYKHPIAETFILDYNGGSLYGESVELEFLKFLRPEIKFSSLNELKNDIDNLIYKI